MVGRAWNTCVFVVWLGVNISIIKNLNDEDLSYKILIMGDYSYYSFFFRKFVYKFEITRKE